MIRHIVGKSIFDTKLQAIVNTVNCDGVMGKGLALEFKRRYPDMFKEYKEKCLKGEIKPGLLHIYRIDKKVIINFPTKKHWKNKSRMEYIEKGLLYLKNNYKAWGLKSIAFPKLGCDLGGLDWSEVKVLMEGYLKKFDIPIEIYVSQKKREGQKTLMSFNQQDIGCNKDKSSKKIGLIGCSTFCFSDAFSVSFKCPQSYQHKKGYKRGVKYDRGE
ncbi:MAG: macro domain-containing protein [Nanoarchaeota archaeon]|nr:macro domain-containing protein [Nanoarchaeota archaeon]MCG2717408.1 macro domain-containing protein [Nanoarchaeota archaeon]